MCHLTQLAFRVAPAGPVLSTGNDPAFRDILAALRLAGDAELRRVRFHAASDGSLTEQFDRTNGFEKSARDLTWSYASFLTALQQRTMVSASFSPLAARFPRRSVPTLNGRDSRLTGLPYHAELSHFAFAQLLPRRHPA